MLGAKLALEGLPHASAVCGDFLDPALDLGRFDVIYAHGVLHHFEHLETFLQILAGALRPGGRVVTFDPLQTSPVIALARGLMRGSQPDRAWEWPLSRRDLATIAQHFEIEEVLGLLGWSKWAMPAAVVPPLHHLALRAATALDAIDRREATRVGPALYRCMSAAMLLRPRADGP